MTSETIPGRMLPRPGELRTILGLEVPVVMVEGGMMLMGGVDTVMVGHLAAGSSSVNLAAVALGHLYFFGIGVFGMGTLMVLDPVVAQAVGARDSARRPAGGRAGATPDRGTARRGTCAGARQAAAGSRSARRGIYRPF